MANIMPIYGEVIKSVLCWSVFYDFCMGSEVVFDLISRKDRGRLKHERNYAVLKSTLVVKPLVP